MAKHKDLANKITRQISGIMDQFQQLSVEIFDKYQLSQEHFNLLETLQGHPGLNLNALTELLDRPLTQTKKLVKDLAQSQYILETGAKEQKGLTLTDAGWQVYKAISKDRLDLQKALFSDLSKGKKKTLIKILDKVDPESP